MSGKGPKPNVPILPKTPPPGIPGGGGPNVGQGKGNPHAGKGNPHK